MCRGLVGSGGSRGGGGTLKLQKVPPSGYPAVRINGPGSSG